MEEVRRTGESRSSAGLRPGGMAKKEEGEKRVGGEMGRDGGGIDLNFGMPEPILLAILSERRERPLARPPGGGGGGGCGGGEEEKGSSLRRLAKEGERREEKEKAGGEREAILAWWWGGMATGNGALLAWVGG